MPPHTRISTATRAAALALLSLGCGKVQGTVPPPVPDAGPTLVEFCAGISDDPLGPTAATSLQSCLDATPDGGALELPPLVFLIGAQLKIDRPLTLRTATLGGDRRSCTQVGITCATLRAAPAFDAEGGMIVLGITTDATLDHLILDGNRGARTGSTAAQACAAGQMRHGENAASAGCTNCSFTYSASMGALCGSGLEWLGDGAQIAESIFQDNGNGTPAGRADGVTVLRSDLSSVIDNFLVDNSGVALSIGGARGASISTNQIRQQTVDSVAAIWLHGPGGASTGDFTGAQVLGNSIDCGAQLCDFGIAVGSHAWDHTVANTRGGLVSNSSIVGAKIGILAEGAGAADAKVGIYHNIINRPVAQAFFGCGQRDVMAQDLSPDSEVDRGDETSTPTSVPWHDCP